MSSESIRKKLAALGPLPGLSEWQRQSVLLLRCQDITKRQFLDGVRSLHQRAEELYQQSLPESMDEETYLVAKSYYDTASQGLECYLNGLEALLKWADTAQDAILNEARRHFEEGDRFSKEVISLGLDAQESFKDAEEAIMRSIGLDPEGIG
jgi:hypothetical protein